METGLSVIDSGFLRIKYDIIYFYLNLNPVAQQFQTIKP